MKKVEYSDYLRLAKPLLKELLTRLLSRYAYASILAVDSRAKSYRVSRQGITAGEVPMLTKRGFVLKLYDGASYGEYSFNELSEDKIPEILNAAETLMELKREALLAGCEESVYEIPNEEEMVFSESTEYEISPEELSDEAILDKLTKISESGRAYDERILEFSSNFAYQRYSKLFLSAKKDMEQSVLWTNGGIWAMAAVGEERKDCFTGFSLLGGAELMDQMEAGIKKVADTAVALLDSEPMKPGTYDCICTPEVTGMIVHEAFGHGVEMDMFVKDRAQAQQFIGEYVASELVTMHDGAAAARECATYFFDDEGVPAKDTVIIEKGILKRGICDSQSAMILNAEPTGNGRRESFERKAYTRMTNTYFEAGTDKLEDMIASIQDGFLLECAASGMEDPKNWGIQCMVKIAREIKDGKLTGKLFSPVVLTGYVPDLLKSISMVSDEVKLGGGGFCGKGYKEWVKVSDGGPYMKARIRLG